MAGAGITNPGYALEQQKVAPEVPTLVTIRDNKIRARSSRHCAARPNQNKLRQCLRHSGRVPRHDRK
jgi:hypothetical protein